MCFRTQTRNLLASYAKLDRRDAALATVDSQAVTRDLQVEGMPAIANAHVETLRSPVAAAD